MVGLSFLMRYGTTPGGHSEYYPRVAPRAAFL